MTPRFPLDKAIRHAVGLIWDEFALPHPDVQELARFVRNTKLADMDSVQLDGLEENLLHYGGRLKGKGAWLEAMQVSTTLKRLRAFRSKTDAVAGD